MFIQYLEFRKKNEDFHLKVDKAIVTNFYQQIFYLVKNTEILLSRMEPEENDKLRKERLEQLSILKFELDYVYVSHSIGYLFLASYFIKKNASTRWFSSHNGFVETLKEIFHNLINIRDLNLNFYEERNLRKLLKDYHDLTLKQNEEIQKCNDMINKYQQISKEQDEKIEVLMAMNHDLLTAVQDMRMDTIVFEQNFPNEYQIAVAKSPRIKQRYQTEKDLEVKKTSSEIIGKQGLISKMTKESQANVAANAISDVQIKQLNNV